MTKPFFDPTKVPAPQDEFVAWVDLMGTSNLMAKQSLKVISSAIFKVHVAALDAKKFLPCEGISLFPVMDGFYATSRDAAQMKGFLSHVFKGLADVFLADKGKPGFQFLARGAVSKGAVYCGNDLKGGSANRLDENPDYRDAILIGMPVVNSHSTESSAPPFGLAIHESAKADFGISETEVWWKWYDEGFDVEAFYGELKRFFDWNLKRKGADGYRIDRIIVHDALARPIVSVIF